MRPALVPVARRSLADDLAISVRELIDSGGYRDGDRLPSIAEMARRFGVAHPTLREALRKLETLGFVDIRHGSGVYVRSQQDTFLVTNPAYSGGVTRQLQVDVLDARMAIELKAVSRAATRVSEGDLERMGRLVARAAGHLSDEGVQAETNVAFHREIAAASGNPVLLQLLDVLAGVIREEQQAWPGPENRARFQREHEEILEALRQRQADLAVERMRAHLESVRAVLMGSDPNGMTAR